MMVDAESAERAFKKFYAKLTQALPINELVADLYANNLLPGRHKSKVDAISTQEEKAQYFLDEIIKPGLSIGYTGQFNKMISVMESSDNPVAEYLGKQVREWAIGASSSSDDDKNGNNTQLHAVMHTIVHKLMKISRCLTQRVVCWKNVSMGRRLCQNFPVIYKSNCVL